MLRSSVPIMEMYLPAEFTALYQANHRIGFQWKSTSRFGGAELIPEGK